MPAKLFVGQIPSVATEAEVRALFQPFGNIVEVYIIKDKVTKMSKGACFVTFATQEEAELAISTLHDRHIMPPQTHTIQVNVRWLKSPQFYPTVNIALSPSYHNLAMHPTQSRLRKGLRTRQRWTPQAQ